MRSRQASSVSDRFTAAAVAAGATLAVVHLAGAFASDGGVVGELLSRLGVALAFVAGGAAVGAIGSRVAAATHRVNDVSHQISATAADHAAETREVLEHLGALALSVRPAKSQESQPTSQTHSPFQTPDADLHARIVALLEEIREISLMDDQQRRARLKQYLDGRRTQTLDEIFHCFSAGRWARANELLSPLEAQFPDDAGVKHARVEFYRLRAAAEDDTLCQTDQQVRDLCQANLWDRAIAAANEFVTNFPGNVDGKHLVTQVCRDFDTFRETSFQHLYEQVQANVDRRLWRAALADAQRLLEEFPDHVRADRVRQQLKTISENADIEQRREQEIRIESLVKSRRFAEAVELAEDVVQRYPDSPQADALEQRLPQLRELAGQGDGNGS